MPDAKPRTLGRDVVLPTALAAVGFGLLGLFLSTFLRDAGTLLFGMLAGWVAFALGRGLAFWDVPRGHGLVGRHIFTGLAVGFAGFAFLRGIFVDGPAVWLIVGGFGFGLYRAHRVLLRDARERAAGHEGARWLGVFHPKDVQALVVLLAGYATVGLAGFMVLRAILGLLPGGGQMLAVATAAYALHGARLLLKFAAEDRSTSQRGIVSWIKANALQNAIVVLLLVAYAVFRARLAAGVPFFPLVEFGLGVAIFGFVLARLRAKLRKDGTLLATASEARDHERVVSEIRELDYDAVARPVTRFIESGQGRDEYARALLASLSTADARAEDIRTRVLSHREPPRAPPLDLSWGLAAGGALTLGLGVGAFALGLVLMNAPLPYPFHLALLFVAFGTYAQQDVARAHHRPRLALAIAGAGTALLLLDFLLFAAEIASLGSVPSAVWWIVAGIVALMLGIPAYSAWKQEKRIAAGAVVDARALSPALEHTREIQKARRRAATMAIAAFVALLPAPWLAGWLASRGIIPGGFPDFFDDVLAVAICVIAAFGAAALVRFYGLTRARPQLLAREKTKRDRRLRLHKEVMQSIERS